MIGPILRAGYPGTLTTWGLIVTGLAIVLSAIYSYVKEYADHQLYEDAITGQNYLETLLRSVTNIKSRKRRRFVQYISDNVTSEKANPFRTITQPETQLREIALEMQRVFADIFAINHTQIGISIACRLGEEEEWRIPARVNVGSPDHIEKLLATDNSAFARLFKESVSILFIPDKSKASTKGHYEVGDRDKSNGCVGSLVCAKVTVSGSRTFANGVLSISTYEDFLYPEGDESSEFKIRNQVLPPFIERIQLEFALMFIKHLMTPNDVPSIDGEQPKPPLSAD